MEAGSSAKEAVLITGGGGYFGFRLVRWRAATCGSMEQGGRRAGTCVTPSCACWSQLPVGNRTAAFLSALSEYVALIPCVTFNGADQLCDGDLDYHRSATSGTSGDRRRTSWVLPKSS